MKLFAIIVLVLGCIFSTLWFLFATFAGKSAIHEILAAVYLLIAIVCVAGLGIICAIEQMTSRLPKPRPPMLGAAKIEPRVPAP